MTLVMKVRDPGISITLFKNVGRTKVSGSGPAVSTRYSGQSSVLDVTSYLGDRGSVRTSKSVRAAAGEFTIDFVDKLVVNEGDSLYGLFEPMDIVEIRMAANAYQYNGLPTGTATIELEGADNTQQQPTSSLPIMMRGFISRVSRSQSIGQDGKPVRKVTISGHDYGKIWQIYQINYNPWMPDDGNYITAFKLFTRFGIAFTPSSAGQFVKDVLAKIINPFIDTMQANANTTIPDGNSPLLNIGEDVQIDDGSISPFGTNNFQGGSIHALLQQYCDVGPWNELFIEDRKTGPYLVFRPNPFIVAGGDPSNASNYINAGATPPTINSITLNEVISIEVSRSDANVANYFWVESPAYDMSFGLLGKDLAAQGARDTFVLNNYGNVDSALYGYKRMSEQTNQGSPLQSSGNGSTKADQSKDSGLTLTWIQARRTALAAQNKDNIVFETGSMRIVGNELVKAGTYLMLKHGNMNSSYYVVSVAHAYTPFGTYVTTVNFERGSGFIDRTQRGVGWDSPYLAELADAQTGGRVNEI